MSFINGLKEEANITYTENGGRAVSTSGSALLDLFANIGGMRERNASDITSMWRSARLEDKELADNLILYTRGVRNGGIGERKIGRILLKELAKIDPSKIIRNFQTIVDCGRWDDLFIFIGTPVENEMWDFLKNRFMADLKAFSKKQPISLLAKWMKSENTSSKESKAIARQTRIKFGLTPCQYRKTLSSLRRYIKVVENQISSNNWDSINYETVPSNAMMKYRNAFGRHSKKFEEYLNKLKEGKAKINSGTLYPYDIVKKILDGEESVVLEEQWKALPNYINEDYEVVFITDTSGSMFCDNKRPISTAIGLTIYFAQHNKGAYHNLFMTFSEHPEVLSIKDEWNLETCVNRIRQVSWGFNTNIDAAFGLIYQIAKEANESPKAICLVSDMQIDQWGSIDSAKTITQKWANKYEAIGLTAPKLIYWNVEARNNAMLAKSNENVSFVSGSGIGPFKNFITLIDKSAYEAMEEILSQSQFCWR